MSKIISVHFSSKGIPVSGLTPTIDIYELDAINPLINTLVINDGVCIEIGGGWYRYDFLTYDFRKNYVFTFDGGVVLLPHERFKCGGNDGYVEDISSEVWNEPLITHIDPGSTGEALAQARANTATILINEVTMLTLLNLLLKYERNRTKIDVPNNQLIIYDNDGITPLTVFNLKDFNGMPSVASVCERVPTP